MDKQSAAGLARHYLGELAAVRRLAGPPCGPDERLEMSFPVPPRALETLLGRAVLVPFIHMGLSGPELRGLDEDLERALMALVA